MDGYFERSRFHKFHQANYLNNIASTSGFVSFRLILLTVIVVQDRIFSSFFGLLALRTTYFTLCAVEAHNSSDIAQSSGILAGTSGWRRDSAGNWGNKHAFVVTTFSYRR